MEFASRTHQNGTPALARDYIPATLDQAAMPVRVEKWQLDGELVYRIVGILWGGYQLISDGLTISFDGGEPEPITGCLSHTTNQTWTLWEHVWRPPRAGSYEVRMHIADPDLAQKRLKAGWYARTIVVDEA
jgi:hypothetical protein